MRRVVFAMSIAIALIGLASPAKAEDSELCRFKNDALTEISGIATSTRFEHTVWAHNDSGGGPYLYAVDTTTCKITATITLEGVKARDFEAIAMGDGRIWLGDIGDNLDSWSSVALLTIKEPKDLSDVTVTPTTYRFTYEDRPHNAEALMVDPNTEQVWVITKQLAHGSLYALPNPMRTDQLNIATKVKRQGSLVTDAAISPNARRYVVRDYVNAKLYDGLPPGKKTDQFILPFQIQGEAVTWTADSTALIIASERDRALIRVEVPTPEPTPEPTPTKTATPAPTPAPNPQPSLPSNLEPVFVASGIAALLIGGVWLILWRQRVRKHKKD